MSEADMAPRYVAEMAVNCLWRVIDRRTGQPAVVNGLMQIGMQEREAVELAVDLCATIAGPSPVGVQATSTQIG